MAVSAPVRRAAFARAGPALVTKLRARSEITDVRLSRSRPGIGIVSPGASCATSATRVVFSLASAALIRCRPAGEGGTDRPDER